MKLTNKILIALSTLIFIITVTTSVIVLANIEIAVTPRIEGHIERELLNHSFSEIIISRGIRVNLTQSDSFSVKVKGADNFVNNYLNIEQKGEKLLFIVKPGIKHYKLYATVDISAPVLEKIVIEESAFEYQAIRTSLILSNFVLDNLDVNLSADGVLNSINCEINNLKMKCSKFASAVFDSCKIKNVDYFLEDYSYARISNVLGNITGELNDNSILSFSKLEGEPKVLRSKQSIELFQNEKEHLTDLTWGSSMEGVEQIIKSNFGSKISEEYYFQNYRYKNLFPLMSHLEFKGGSYLGIEIEQIRLQFYRYSLNGLSMFFKDTSGSIENNYKILLEDLKEKYTSSQFSESGHKTNWKVINENNEVETAGVIFHDKMLHLFIYPEEFQNIIQNEWELKHNKYKSLRNYGKRQNKRYENSIESLIYYGLNN
ncbi:MAG: DUF2807 domain-containing protein [Bacteroidota bacterium]